MKMFSAIFLIFALLVMNIATVAHADGFQEINCGGEQNIKSLDDGSKQDNLQVDSDCCACGHHHLAQAFSVSMQMAQAFPPRIIKIPVTSQTYLSQRSNPPSRPPKA